MEEIVIRVSFSLTLCEYAVNIQPAFGFQLESGSTWITNAVVGIRNKKSVIKKVGRPRAHE